MKSMLDPTNNGLQNLQLIQPEIYIRKDVETLVSVPTGLPLPASRPYFQLISSKLALSSFNWLYKLRSSIFVYILVVKVLKKRAQIESLKLGKSQNLIISKNFNAGMSEYLQKLWREWYPIWNI